MNPRRWIEMQATRLTESMDIVSPSCDVHPQGHVMSLVPSLIGDIWTFDTYLYAEPGYCMGDDDVSRTIRLYGVWEPTETTDFIGALLRSPGIVIDFGAQIGWYSRVASNHDRLVLAIEPVVEHCVATRRNAADVTVAHHWVWANSPVLGSAGAPRIACVKIDLEGAEVDAIRMLSELLDADKIDNILMEVSPTFNDTYPDLIRGLMARGFTAKVCNPEQPFTFDEVDAVVAQAPQVDMMFTRQR